MIMIVMVKWLLCIKEHSRCLAIGSLLNMCIDLSHVSFNPPWLIVWLEYVDSNCQIEPHFSLTTCLCPHHFLLFKFLWVEDEGKVPFCGFSQSELAFPMLYLAIRGPFILYWCLKFLYFPAWTISNKREIDSIGWVCWTAQSWEFKSFLYNHWNHWPRTLFPYTVTGSGRKFLIHES